MTTAQASLLRRLIEADRAYWTKVTNKELVHRDERGVEVSWMMGGVNQRTAQSLIDLGLAETLQINRQTWIFLGKYTPTDSE